MLLLAPSRTMLIHALPWHPVIPYVARQDGQNITTDILAYAEGVNGAEMKRKALELVQKLPGGAALLSVQTLGELFNLLVRKARRTPSTARRAILSWMDAFPLIETSGGVLLAA